ncbi:hypothetical protein ACWEO2_27105 [Nocardia sp. NPDC004278]
MVTPLDLQITPLDLQIARLDLQIAEWNYKSRKDLQDTALHGTAWINNGLE